MQGTNQQRGGNGRSYDGPGYDGPVIEPSRQRRAQGGVIRLERPIPDTQGNIGRPWACLDTLSVMLNSGSIDLKMQAAGIRFHDHFRRAGLDHLRGGDLLRVPVQLAGARVWARNGGNEAARLQVLSALDALGGVQQPGGSCAWHVLGCEMSLHEWASSRGWAGRRINHRVAAGILIADLGILCRHWQL